MSELKTLIDYIYENKALKADHVSKKALREWCENSMGEMTSEYDYAQGQHDVCYTILSKFCKEGK